MANRERGDYSWRVRDRTFTLRLTVEGCVDLEDRTEQSFEALQGRVNRGQMKALRWLVWAALQPYHADAVRTVDHAGILIDQAGGPKPVLVVMAALLVLNSDDEPKPPATGKQASRSDATGSGSSWRALYLEARAIGIPADTFWQLSLRELWRELAVARLQARRAHEQTVSLAWHIAALVWQKKLPTLDKLLGQQRAQTVQEQRAMLMVLSEQYGIPLRKATARVADK